MRYNSKTFKIFVLVMGLMFLIFAFGPISQAKENKIHYFNQNYFLQPAGHNPPIPGDMSEPYPNFKENDFSQQKSVPYKILSQFASDKVIDMIGSMDESLILGYLENLTSFGPRVTGTTACYDAGDYIYNEFESMGLDVRFHNWSYSGYTDRNVEATLPGIDEESDEIYIICAHYDSVPGSPGADDDGSGTVAVMASAFIMKDFAFNHTIRFVTFSGEEQGLLGSHEYVVEADSNGDNIVAVLNVDMIGYALTTEQGNRVNVYYNTASQWLTDYTDEISEQYYDYIELEVIPSGYSWGSDHYYFWEYGYDALFYHEYKFNDYYHSPQDTIENMNLTYSAKCSKLIIATLAELSLPCDISDPPNEPTITGPSSGMTWMEYEFNVTTTDPNGDDVYYLVDWGDDTSSGLIGPFESGEKVTLAHSWNLAGDYEINAKAKDIYNVYSDWSDPFTISIIDGAFTEIQSIKGGLFKVRSEIKNIGVLDATNVNWKISLEGGAFIGKETEGSIATITAGEERTIKSNFILGFGPTQVTIRVWMTDGPSDFVDQAGYILFFLISI
jgi:hypothetical protein